jgi:hypothetical protein
LPRNDSDAWQQVNPCEGSVSVSVVCGCPLKGMTVNLRKARLFFEEVRNHQQQTIAKQHKME